MTTSPTTNQTRLGFALAWVFFGISLWLPAFDTYSGWKCAEHVWGLLVGRGGNLNWGWLYHAAFNVTNFTLLVLPVLAFTPLFDRFRLTARWLAGGCFLHTLSWFIWGLCNGGIRELKVGYYLWLLAVGVLLASCVVRVRSLQNISPTNTPPQASLA